MDEDAIQGHGIGFGGGPEILDEDVTQSQLGEFEFCACQTCL
jgi:hypothetical protein